jgi:pentatricopeptide repeat protein
MMMSAVQDSPVFAVAQEILVLAVFFTSFVLWRKVNSKNPKNQKCRPLQTCQAHHHATAGALSAQKSLKEAFATQGSRTDTADEGRLHHVLEQGSRPTVQPQSRATEQQMLKLLEQREFTRALNMYRACERDGRDRHFTNEELFSAFIQSAIRVGKIDVLERMLRAMRRNGILPSLKFWQTTLKMLSSRKHFNACISTHVLFARQIPADKVVYSCLINAALECNSPELAAQMLDKYGEADIDAKDYVLHFRTYVALGDVDTAEVVFKKLGTEVTTLMLNLLLLTCVNVKQSDRALVLLHEAHQLEAGETIVDAVSYNTVIKGFAQSGKPTRCFECLHEMRAKGLEPDDITFGTLLDVCIAGSNIGGAYEVVDLLAGSDRKMDTVMCTLFIKGLVRASCLPKAIELYEQMRQREGASPDIVTYSVLIKACIDGHDLERALCLLEDLRSAGRTPDDIILTHLLEGCRHAGNHVLGKKLFAEMVDSGIKPSEYTLITMVKLHGRCGAHEEAHDLVANWEARYGAKPSVIHFTCLMSGCLRTKSYDRAWVAYELMCQNGVRPDETTVATLLPGMVVAQQWDKCLLLVRQSLKSPNPINIATETLNSALIQMQAAGGLGRYAEQMQELMKGANIPITARSSAKRVS